jgi:hypothetical protein
MTALNPAVGTRLEWRQPRAFERYHELTVGDEITGTLRFEKRCGTLATAEYGGRSWTFKRTGFWSPRVSIREAGSPDDTAIFTPKWKGGRTGLPIRPPVHHEIGQLLGRPVDLRDRRGRRSDQRPWSARAASQQRGGVGRAHRRAASRNTGSPAVDLVPAAFDAGRCRGGFRSSLRLKPIPLYSMAGRRLPL